MGKRTGRPAKPASDRKTVLITLRLKVDEIMAIDAAAKKAGQKRSEWARKTLTSAVNVLQ